MIGTTPGFPPMGPGMTTNAVNSMRNKGYISLPVTLTSANQMDVMQTQKNVYDAGMRGLGDGVDLSTFDPASLFAGSGGTLMLLGVVVGVYYLSKYAFGGEAKKKRAKKRYDRDIESVKARYSKYGFGKRAPKGLI